MTSSAVYKDARIVAGAVVLCGAWMLWMSVRSPVGMEGVARLEIAINRDVPELGLLRCRIVVGPRASSNWFAARSVLDFAEKPDGILGGSVASGFGYVALSQANSECLSWYPDADWVGVRRDVGYVRYTQEVFCAESRSVHVLSTGWVSMQDL